MQLVEERCCAWCGGSMAGRRSTARCCKRACQVKNLRSRSRRRPAVLPVVHELSFDRTNTGHVASCACGWQAVPRLAQNDSHYDGALHLAAESRVAEEREVAAAVAEELAQREHEDDDES